MEKTATNAAVYDEIYSRFPSSQLFDDALRAGMGREYSSILGQFSFLKRAELNVIEHQVGGMGERLRGLDIGCGTGYLPVYLGERFGGDWTGLDRSQAALIAARERSQSGRLKFVLGDIERLPFRSGSFDCLIAIDTLQHATSYARCARELRRVLRPGGVLIFTNWMMAVAKERLIAVDPLLTALSAHGFEQLAVVETDRGLELQIAVYRALYERREDIERLLGATFLSLMVSEATYIIERRSMISRYITVAKC
jgi:ubiquinone/menaquinone biosynthesis C-methylase UbiE